MLFLQVGVMVVATLAAAVTARATLIVGPDIIPAPPSVINDPPGAVNTHQQGFNERQNVLLPASINVDGGSIVAGTRVSSHMIFLNTLGGALANDVQTWTFDGLVLGVMSDGPGLLEGATTPLLGALGTVYPAPFSNRGLESNDSYIVAGNQLTLRNSVTQPGDWIRVVTASAVPDSSPGLWGIASVVAMLAWCRRRFKSGRS
jgi:hypothetical protein